MKLTSKTRYGTRILIDLAIHQGNQAVQMGEISKRQGVSLKYLEQLIRPLKKAGFVLSKRGPKGGHRLNKKPENMTLGQITRLFEEHYELKTNDKNTNDYGKYQDFLIQKAWQEAKEALYGKLDGITIADLMTCSEKLQSAAPAQP